MNKYILGINAYHADSSVALIKDGEVIFALEEERLTRVKHWAGVPIKAIKAALDFESITIDDVSAVAIGRAPKAKLFRKVLFLLKRPSLGFKLLKLRILNRQQILNINRFLILKRR